MKSQKGFIQIPILITIIVGALIIGASYVGVKRYQDYRLGLIKKEQLALIIQQEKDSGVEKLRQEIEIFKEQKPQIITQEIIKEIPSFNVNNVKPETLQEEIPTPSLIKTQNQAPNITEIVGHWRFFTAKVENLTTSESGSGLVVKSSDGNFKILTNKHVVENGTAFNIKLPENPIDNILRSNIKYIAHGSADFATISLGNSNEYLKNLIAEGSYRGICSENQKPILGDEIVILGYPMVAGSHTDVTVTKGIISGFEGIYFITDAKINPGNSGGIAINIKNNCYFGIPTYTVTPEYNPAHSPEAVTEALGRILDIWKVMGQF